MLPFVHLFVLSLIPLCTHSQDVTTTEPVPSTTTPPGPITTPPVSTASTTGTSGSTGTSRSSSTRTSSSSAFDPSAPPDVELHVPELHVGRIELDVEQLSADINLNAKVAQLVQLNAGVQLSVQKINLTIVDVNAKLDLTVRLGHLVDIVNRVFESIDLNPLLIELINGVTDLIGDVIGVVDGLIGSITQGGKTLNFIIDNLGNIVQQVTGGEGESPVSTIVGDYVTNMTFTGIEKTLGNGLVQKTFRYDPLNALVDIVFNAAGQVVQAVVQKKKGGGTTTKSATSAPTSTAGARRKR